MSIISGSSIAASGNYSSDFDIRPILKMLEQELYVDAIDELHYELDYDPDNADILSLLGYSYRKTQNYEDALTFYEWALNAKPDHLGANEYLGELYLDTNRLDKAEQQLKILSNMKKKTITKEEAQIVRVSRYFRKSNDASC